MKRSDRLPAAEVRIGDIIWLSDGTGYRVRKVTPSPSGKLIQINMVVEIVASGGPELGRHFNLGKRAGTSLTVERAG